MHLMITNSKSYNILKILKYLKNMKARALRHEPFNEVTFSIL